MCFSDFQSYLLTSNFECVSEPLRDLVGGSCKTVCGTHILQEGATNCPPPPGGGGLVDTRVLVDEENKKNIKNVILILNNLVKTGHRV